MQTNKTHTELKNIKIFKFISAFYSFKFQGNFLRFLVFFKKMFFLLLFFFQVEEIRANCILEYHGIHNSQLQGGGARTTPGKNVSTYFQKTEELIKLNDLSIDIKSRAQNRENCDTQKYNTTSIFAHSQIHHRNKQAV